MRNLKLRADVRHQTIDNFGASACWWMDYVGKAFSPAETDEIARLLFDRETGAGLSCIRFNIGAGSAWYDREYVENWFMRSECFQMGPNAPYDWSTHAGQQMLLRQAKRYGVERTIAFLNSPPAFMTANGHTRCDGTTGTTNLKYGNEPMVSRFICDVLKHFERIDLPFDYISPINEPQVPWDGPKQEGCRYSNEDTIRFVLALAAEMRRSDIASKILINECNNILSLPDIAAIEPYLQQMPEIDRHMGWQFGGKYCELMKDVFDLPDIRDAVAPIVAAHSYGTDGPGMMTLARELARRDMARYGGYDYWMTEYCVLGPDGPKRDLGIDAGLLIAPVIHADLAVAGASAWQWWLAVSGSDYKDGLVYVDLDEQGNAGGVHSSKMLWALGHYARFLRPGSVRLELEGSDLESGILATAWRAADGRPVFVFVNTTEADETVIIEGLEPGWYEAYITDAARDMEKTALPGAAGGFALGARSMMTVVRR